MSSEMGLLAMDSLGFPLFTHCTKANISDDVGLIEMFKQSLDYFREKLRESGKTTILLDKGYHPERIRKELEKFYPEIRDKLQFELSAKPSKEGSPR
ncbi:MAG: hypothetical protein PHP00_04260 [Thiotrichaceae bacterium]|nr:hypothetical protein [Thiotrichaceae bacterium]